MADAVAVRTILETRESLVLHLTNVSDGTGEAAVIKADKSTYLAPDGAEPASLDIDWVRWSIQGFARIQILWDHTTDDLALVLCGSGYDDYRNVVDGKESSAVGTLRDPRSSGGTGDILLTAPAGATTGSYDITIGLRKQSN